MTPKPAPRWSTRCIRIRLLSAVIACAALGPAQPIFAADEPATKQEPARPAGPAENLETAKGLEKRAAELQSNGRFLEAQRLYARSIAIREQLSGREHADLVPALLNLARACREQQRYADAEQALMRAIRIQAKNPRSTVEVAASLAELGSLADAQGHYSDAEKLISRSLEMREQALGTDDPAVAQSLNNLAALRQAQGRYAEAESLFKKSLDIWERWEFNNGVYKRRYVTGDGWRRPEHADLAATLQNLGVLADVRGRYEEGERLLNRAISMYERILGPEDPRLVRPLDNLAIAYRNRGRLQEAEALFKRSLAIQERGSTPDHPDTAATLTGLAVLYQEQDRLTEAEALFKRALAIRERALGPKHPQVAESLNNLAVLYSKQRRYASMEPLIKRSLAIRTEVFGPEHDAVAQSMHNLAALYARQNRRAESEELYRKSLTIQEKSLGGETPAAADALNNLGASYMEQSRFAEAESHYKRALAIRERAFGPDHPMVAQALHNLADLHQSQGQRAAALPLVRRASAIYRDRIVRGSTDEIAPRESASSKTTFYLHISLLGFNPADEPVERVANEAFEIAQLIQSTRTGIAVTKMAARFSKGDDALAALVRRRQDLTDRLNGMDSAMLRALAKPGDANAALRNELRDDIGSLGREIAAIDDQLQSRFPQYRSLTRLDPVPINVVQSLLQPNEAMVAYSLSGAAGWAWVVRPQKALFLPLKADRISLAKQVGAIRVKMQPDRQGRIELMDAAELHRIHESVFAPLAAHLQGVTHVIVVPDGPLQSIPFSMLAASPPPNGDSYAKVDWLAKRYAISTLPAVGAIRSLREVAKAPTGQEPFAGFGDPQLTDSSTAGESSRRVAMDSIFRGPNDNAQRGRPDIADVRTIKRAPSLPETADELRAMARALGAPETSVWLRENATESEVKHRDLSKYRIVAFATHGVMAGELIGIAEPGLILTPPAEGTEEDDGYLSSSEIARLKLNAELVVLSACNTAAPDGTPGAEGLSGLARAFFYAGSRSLLVSHWPVESGATVALTTTMLREYEAQPALGKAEAHRKAMLALMSTSGHPEYSHPFFWAPFVVVGEGGR